MHSLNMDIDKMEDEIKSLQSEASKALAENKGKDDHWQQLKHNTMARVDRLTDQDRSVGLAAIACWPCHANHLDSRSHKFSCYAACYACFFLLFSVSYQVYLMAGC
jgi:hypothetical protein